MRYSWLSWHVKEHRSSYKGDFTSINSRIINDADSLGLIDIKVAMERTYLSYIDLYPKEEHYNKVRKHLIDKFGYNGYSRFKTEEVRHLTEDKTRELSRIIENEEEFEIKYNEVIANLT